MRRCTVLLFGCVLAVGVLLVGAEGLAQKGKPKGKTHKVLMLDDEYKPGKLTIEVGDTVVWVNKGKRTHTAGNDDEKAPKEFAFDTDDVEPGASSKPFTFTKAGQVKYSCLHHRKMKGELVIKERGKVKE